MQFKVLTALLLVGACSAQVSLSLLNTDIQQIGIVRDLISQAKAANEKLINDMTETTLDALKNFDQLKEQVESEASDAIASAEQLLNKVISDAQNQIQKRIDQATELGIDITICTNTTGDQFTQLLKDFLKDEVQCVQEEIDHGFKIIYESIAIVTGVIDEFQTLPGKLRDCGTGLSSFECINKVTSETAKLDGELPIKITNQVAETTLYVAGLKSRLEVCATVQVAGAIKEAAEIVAEVSQCVAKAIEHN